MSKPEKGNKKRRAESDRTPSPPVEIDREGEMPEGMADIAPSLSELPSVRPEGKPGGLGDIVLDLERSSDSLRGGAERAGGSYEEYTLGDLDSPRKTPPLGSGKDTEPLSAGPTVEVVKVVKKKKKGAKKDGTVRLFSLFFWELVFGQA